jgi:hypothetical protein
MAQTATRLLPLRIWTVDTEGCHRIDGADCYIWMQKRPAHCDRGRWLAHVELKHPHDPRAISIDYADLWPRYYFDLDRAKAEIEAWLLIRKQVI